MKSGKAVWGVLLGVGLLFEAYALFNRKTDDTLSELVWDATDLSPFVPFAIGVICGHWFAPRNK